MLSYFRNKISGAIIDEPLIRITMEENPSSLFEFFDNEGICIEIFTEGDNLTYKITNKKCNNRKEVEKKALEEAIKILSEKYGTEVQ